MPSLPPELILQVLDHALHLNKSPRRLLRRCSLVNLEWKDVAQTLLFQHYSRLIDADGAQAWLECERRELAEVLELSLSPPSREDRKEEAEMVMEATSLIVNVLSSSERLRELYLHLSRCALSSVLSLSTLESAFCFFSSLEHALTSTLQA
jgi:hypothetical protein